MHILSRNEYFQKPIYNKEYLKTAKRFSTKEIFQWFYVPEILLYSVYRKDGNYYPEVYLENFIHNFLGGSIINLGFLSSA